MNNLKINPLFNAEFKPVNFEQAVIINNPNRYNTKINPNRRPIGYEGNTFSDEINKQHNHLDIVSPL